MRIPEEVEKKMLDIAGEKISGGMSSYDIERLSNEDRATVMDGSNAVVVSGYTPGRCYGNSLDYFLKNDGNVHICSGFAFNNDSKDWIAHAWCVDDSGTVYECTGIKRDIYYGYVMNREEELKFYNDNFFELDEISNLADTPFAKEGTSNKL